MIILHYNDQILEPLNYIVEAQKYNSLHLNRTQIKLVPIALCVPVLDKNELISVF
jgi:hypothetical protein